jgi:hypothetical protein
MQWRLSAWIWIAALLVAVATAFVTFQLQAIANPADRCICDIEMNTTGRGTAQLSSDAFVSSVPLQPPGVLTMYRFYFPAGVYDRMQFEPFQGKGQATITRVRLADPNDQTLAYVPPDEVRAVKDVEAIARSGIGNTIISKSADAEPMVAFGFDDPLMVGHSKGASMLYSTVIALVSFPLWALAIGFVVQLNARAA